ncbi:MAG: Cys-Gln thioester bond-forming surface protein [Phycisphaerales bacterium]
MRPVLRAASLAGAIAIAATSANADVVQMKFLGTGAGRNVTIRSSGYDGGVFAGQLEHRINAPGDSPLDGDWITYCVDYYDFVSSRYNQFYVSNLKNAPDHHPMGEVKAQAIVDLYAYAGGAQLDPHASNDFAAAFQLAIWEIIDDYNGSASSLNINAGDFQAWTSSSWRSGHTLDSRIADYLCDLFDAVGTGGRVPGLVALINDCYQDQIVYTPAPGVLAGFGVLGLGASRRRRRA